MKQRRLNTLAALCLMLPSSLLAQTSGARVSLPNYTEGQCKMAALRAWHSHRERLNLSTSAIEYFQPTSPNGRPTPAEQAKLSQAQAEKAESIRLKAEALQIAGTFGGYDLGSAPMPLFPNIQSMTPVLQACRNRYARDIDAAQRQRWVEIARAADGKAFAVNSASIKTVGSEVHMAVMTTLPTSQPYRGLGVYRSSVLHLAFSCAGSRYSRAGLYYFLRPATDNIFYVGETSDTTSGSNQPITDPNTAMASFARVACGEFRLSPDAPSFSDLRSFIANQERAQPPPPALPK